MSTIMPWLPIWSLISLMIGSRTVKCTWEAARARTWRCESRSSRKDRGGKRQPKPCCLLGTRTNFKITFLSRCRAWRTRVGAVICDGTERGSERWDEDCPKTGVMKGMEGWTAGLRERGKGRDGSFVGCGGVWEGMAGSKTTTVTKESSRGQGVQCDWVRRWVRVVGCNNKINKPVQFPFFFASFLSFKTQDHMFLGA